MLFSTALARVEGKMMLLAPVVEANIRNGLSVAVVVLIVVGSDVNQLNGVGLIVVIFGVVVVVVVIVVVKGGLVVVVVFAIF